MPSIATQGQRIRARRIACRYTQEYLAAQLHTTKQAIYKYEADIVHRIPPDKFTRLAQLLDCSVDYLCCEAEQLGTPPMPAAENAPGVDVQSLAAQEDPFQFYQQLMDVTGRLAPAARRELLDFGEFLLARQGNAL